MTQRYRLRNVQHDRRRLLRIRRIGTQLNMWDNRTGFDRWLDELKQKTADKSYWTRQYWLRFHG